MPKMTSETWLWPGPLPVEKVTIAPMGERRQTFYLEISNETADWVTGKQLKKDGQWAENKQGQNIIQIIDRTAIVKRIPVEMNVRYGEYEEVKTMSNPTTCTGCGKAISGAYEAGSYSCSDCGTGVEINPVEKRF